jgi:glycosyltransferase involved in cell wall biosynthesis
VTRLLVECTYVFEHPADNSGIQRVVRNIIRELPGIAVPAECIPVIMRRGALYRVLSLTLAASPADLPLLQRWVASLRRARNAVWDWRMRMQRLRPVQASGGLRQVLNFLCIAVNEGLLLPQRACMALEEWRSTRRQLQRLALCAGDQLVLLDSSWHGDFFPVVEGLKAHGVGVVSVIYDLVPLTHPQFCDPGLVKAFDAWLDWILRTADGYLAISRTVSDQLQAEIERRLGKDAAGRCWHDHFRLGSDLDLAHLTANLDRRMLPVFSTDVPVYLVVGTIEPRKNHAYVLDAFDSLWARGCAARLCIIGKIGWKCDELVARIRTHVEFNQRLFLCNDIDDSSLAFAYQSARALLFPSFVEGFGLPVVEAMQRGLPVMASDIPVFREIGGEFVAYFDLQNPQSLVEKIVAFESTRVFPAARAVAQWQWPGWHEACQQFVQKVLGGLRAGKGKNVLIKN